MYTPIRFPILADAQIKIDKPKKESHQRLRCRTPTPRQAMNQLSHSRRIMTNKW